MQLVSHVTLYVRTVGVRIYNVHVDQSGVTPLYAILKSGEAGRAMVLKRQHVDTLLMFMGFPFAHLQVIYYWHHLKLE
ncbi:hypothetical protein MHYP_G00137140 [Metynnis hypsauchen]